MRSLGLVAVMFGLLLAGCTEQGTATAQPQTAPRGDIVGIASVVDGDTIEIYGTRVRLSGFDTPESDKRCGDTNVYHAAANALDS